MAEKENKLAYLAGSIFFIVAFSYYETNVDHTEI